VIGHRHANKNEEAGVSWPAALDHPDRNGPLTVCRFDSRATSIDIAESQQGSARQSLQIKSQQLNNANPTTRT
jgi:hypothetical protein